MTSRKNGPWTVKSKETVFENPWIRVEDHQTRQPDGSAGQYGVVRFKNRAIGVLPVDSDGSVWLVGQHRFAHDAYSWELPEGGGPLGDDPLVSAQRELAEETGLSAREWHQFSAFDTSNSVTDEKAIAYLAWDLETGQAAPEPSEALTIKKIKFNTLLDLVMDGEITDGFTIIMVLTAHVLALQGRAPKPISDHLAAGRALR